MLVNQIKVGVQRFCSRAASPNSEEVSEPSDELFNKHEAVADWSRSLINVWVITLNLEYNSCVIAGTKA